MSEFLDLNQLPPGQRKVANAAWKVLLENSERPTSGNIVKYGYIPDTTGKQTIVDGIEGFWNALSQSMNTWMHIPQIPMELENAIVSIYKDLNLQADSRFTEKQTQFEKVITDLRVDNEDSRQEGVSLKKDLTMANNTIKNHILNDQDNSKIMLRQTDEIKEIRLERNDVERSFSNLQAEVAALEKRIKDNKKDHANTLKEEAKRYEHNDSMHLNQNDKLNIEMNRINKKLDREAKEHRLTITAATDKFDQLTENYNNLLSNERETNASLQQIEKELARRKNEEQQLKKDNKSLETQIKLLEGNAHSSNITVAEQAELIKQLHIGNQSQQATNETLMKQLTSLTSVMDKMASQTEKLKKKKDK
ncbi:hypothetical protein MNBD_GAMMA12-1291 [hydrothermal vent metagenome]|uniref:Uncharacterized protein n=1 Tax=hydrothermal vent metagenome TaxID=652676 RepID=A0A3B0XSB4_9ZZZZ